MRLTVLDKVEPREFATGDPATWHERGCPTERRIVTSHYLHPVESLAEAQAIRFLCPKCFTQNMGPVGTHSCEVTFSDRGVTPEQGCHNAEGQPTRWTVTGTGFHDLTTWPSILIQGGCNWHGYITNGEVS